MIRSVALAPLPEVRILDRRSNFYDISLCLAARCAQTDAQLIGEQTAMPAYELQKSTMRPLPAWKFMWQSKIGKVHESVVTV